MRTKLVHALTIAAVLGAMLATPGAGIAPTATAAPQPAAEQYSWRNVEIAGGGFVPGIIFNRTEPNLIYARTDIGGAYRWNQSTGRWLPLLDWVGWHNWGYNGVVSLATDARDPNRVYVAAGMYTNSWDPNNGAILRSADRGATWQVSPLPFKLGGNMPGRGMGERLAVDPNDNRIVYLGAPDGNGLWRSTDSGANWAKVTAFPNPGNWAQDPNDPNGYLSHRPGVVWVTFDEGTGSAGSATRSIYAGVADKENTVYRSTDAGATWQRIAGQPTGYLAHKGVLDTTNDYLYLATSDTGGPYDGSKGDVWKYHTVSGTWTQISPIPSSSADDYFGYSGLTIDRRNPNTLMVATQVSWWPDAIFFRSTDGGATWTRIWDWASYPNRTLRYNQDISSAPWLTFGGNPQPPEVTPKLGWMNESVEIDPHNSNRLMYGTGATIYGTTNLASWDAGQQITIRPMAAGLEETAVLDLISPPSGAPLISGLGDIGGFRHDNLSAVPPKVFTQPNFTTTTSLDYAERNPSVLVRAGNFTDSERPNDSHVAFSTDGGANWFQGSEPGGINEGGTVAAAADGSRFVWAPAGQPVHYSVGFGNSWTQSQGLPTGAVVESDRVNPNKFYGFSGGRFYVSTNGGASFTQTGASGLPSSGKFKALPGIEGDVWLAGDSGLFHSTDSGATFTRLSTVANARNVGFGAPAPGQSYQSVFTVATIGGVTGVYRSDDRGTSWVRVNDDAHQYGNMGEALTGDPRVHGRVYLGTNGRGIVYGERTAGAMSQPLRGHASARNVLIGAAVATGPLGSEPAYRDTLNREFNAVTAENAMKWDATEPAQGQFAFAGADQIMASAQANGQTVHGHTLVWHSQTPSWVQNLDATAMRAAMQNHIRTVVGRYADRIKSWDVVNEVFDDNGGLRNSFWLQRLGENYIADAFRLARAADPAAKLCINDFNVEGINNKSTAMFNLVSRLRGQGVPIDCVGIQGHLAIQFGFPNDLRQNIQRFANLGVEVRITELDVRMQLPVDATKLATQATYYRNVISACLAVSRCTALTVWGFTDKYSWVPSTFPGQGAALPYTENYVAKPAYQALHDALAG